MTSAAQLLPSINSLDQSVVKNKDGSIDHGGEAHLSLGAGAGDHAGARAFARTNRKPGSRARKRFTTSPNGPRSWRTAWRWP